MSVIEAVCCLQNLLDVIEYFVVFLSIFNLLFTNILISNNSCKINIILLQMNKTVMYSSPSYCGGNTLFAHVLKQPITFKTTFYDAVIIS